MNKWILTCLSVFSFLFPVKEKELQTYFLESEVTGGKYGLYVDEECRNAFVDEDNQPIIIEITENETKLEYKEESLYLKQLEPVDGYYLDDEVYLVKKYTQLHSYPFQIGITSNQNSIDLELQNEKKEVLKKWKQEGNGPIDYVFQAGKKYSIHETSKKDFLYTKPVQFEIPLEKPENYELITLLKMESVPYGSVSLSVIDQKKECIKDAKYALFQADKIVKNVYGDSSEKCVDENGKINWDVEEGEYEIRQVEIGDFYYHNPEVVPLHVQSDKSQSITILEQKILFQLQMVDSETKEQIQGKIGYEEEQAESGDVVCLKRNHTYTFSDISHPSGYYRCEPVSFKVSDVNANQTAVTLLSQRFKVCFQVLDVDSKEKIKGGTYQICTPNGDVLQEFSMIDETFETSDLIDETDYVFHENKSPDGYITARDVPFRILKTESGYHTITSEKIPYVVFTQQVLDRNKNEIRADIGIYTDPLCQIEARDVNGNVLNSLRKICMRNGIYYVKIKQLDSHFYKDDTIYKIHLDHSNGIYKTSSIQASSVNLHASVLTNDGNEINEAEIEVLDKDGNLIKAFSNARQVESENEIFERGKEYQVRLKHIDGFYTYEKKFQSIQFDEYRPSVVPSMQFRCEPYIVFRLDGIKNAMYGIYEDERCSVLSRDIYGRSTKKEGSSEWMLRTGTYWLKELTPPSGCYANEKALKIELSTKKWEEKCELSSFPITLTIHISDENNEEVKDSVYEVQDEKHTVLANVKESAVLNGAWLKPAQRLIFHEISTPEGYQENQTDIVYTIPDSLPSSSPIINIKYQKKISNSDAIHMERKKAEIHRSSENSQKQTIPFFIYLGVACAIIAIVISMRKIKHKGR